MAPDLSIHVAMDITYEITPCIACGETDARVVADADVIREEREELWSFHTRRLRPTVPPRQLADRLAFSQPPALRLVQCKRCGLVYRNPIERPADVSDIYSGEVIEPDVMSRLHATQLGALRAQARRLTDLFGRAGTVIEVGSYVGGFLAAARELGWTPIGVDVNPTVNDWVRARGEQVVDGELAAVRDVQADVVAFWNCFDQLPDPAAALREAHCRLRAGGWVVIRVPNGEAYARLRSAPAPIARFARIVLATNNLLAFPYRFGFTRHSATRLLHRAGFSIQHVVGDTLVPVADRWTRRWARHEEQLVKAATRALGRAGLVEPPWIEVYARKD